MCPPTIYFYGHNPPKASFLALPHELRNYIYRYLLISGKRQGCFETRKAIERQAYPVCYPAILRTCREIHNEAKPILYANNEINCFATFKKFWPASCLQNVFGHFGTLSPDSSSQYSPVVARTAKFANLHTALHNPLLQKVRLINIYVDVNFDNMRTQWFRFSEQSLALVRNILQDLCDFITKDSLIYQEIRVIWRPKSREYAPASEITEIENMSFDLLRPFANIARNKSFAHLEICEDTKVAFHGKMTEVLKSRLADVQEKAAQWVKESRLETAILHKDSL